MTIRTILMIVFLLAGAVAAHAGAPDTLRVVYTANTNGKLMACTCPSDPYGGLAERETIISSFRENDDTFLLFDAGKATSLFGNFQARSKTIARLMNLMAYDAAAIDAWDLFNGIEGVSSLRETARFPLLAGTITGQDGTRPFEQFVDISRDGLMARVVSVCDSFSIHQYGAARVNDFALTDVDEAIEHAIEAPDRPAFLVVLSTLEAERNGELLERYPAIDLIIEANGNRKYDMPVMRPTGAIVNPGGRGQYVGTITLVKDETNTVSVEQHTFIPVLDIPASTQTTAIVSEFEESL